MRDLEIKILEVSEMRFSGVNGESTYYAKGVIQKDKDRGFHFVLIKIEGKAWEIVESQTSFPFGQELLKDLSQRLDEIVKSNQDNPFIRCVVKDEVSEEDLRKEKAKTIEGHSKITTQVLRRDLLKEPLEFSGQV